MSKHELTDKVLFFTCCTLMSLLQPLGAWQVVPVLVGAVAVALFTYYAEQKVSLVIGAAFFLACLFYQPLCAFIPVMLYAAYESNRKYVGLISLVPLAAASDLVWPLRLGILMFAAVALVHKHRTASFSLLREHYLSLLDTSRAMGAEIKKQNQLLLAKQDDEIKLARLSERNRIAREMHDHVGHRLSSAFLQIGAMLIKHPEQAGLIELRETLHLAMDNIRCSVHELYESSLDLSAQLEQLAAGLTCCRVESNIQLGTDPEPKVKLALIAAVKEAFTNITKHSDATVARLQLIEHPAFYQLVVSDNGRVAKAVAPQGLGLTSIAERVLALKGHFLVRTQSGFEIFITIPKEAAYATAGSRR
jgi:signal transduction histidine kinase